jgi:hypothetical protein
MLSSLTFVFSIIAAEGAIANVVGMTQMQPPVKDLRKRSNINQYIQVSEVCTFQP